MARPPNYQQERSQRDRAKAAKAAQKQAAKAELREQDRKTSSDSEKPKD